MKKLKKLGRLNLNQDKVLSPSELVNFRGGSGTCGIKSNGLGDEVCGISKEDAMGWAGFFGTYWCCDSCGGNGGSASYC